MWIFLVEGCTRKAALPNLVSSCPYVKCSKYGVVLMNQNVITIVGVDYLFGVR